jgi:hypothetical protein
MAIRRDDPLEPVIPERKERPRANRFAEEVEHEHSLSA